MASVTKTLNQSAGAIKDIKIILSFVAVMIVVVMIIRFMRRDKRAAKQEAKEFDKELEAIKAKNETTYSNAASTFNSTKSDAQVCDAVAAALAKAIATKHIGSYGYTWLGKTDDDAVIIEQVNRLRSFKHLQMLQFFYKTYRSNLYTELMPEEINVANDILAALSSDEEKRLNADILTNLKKFKS